MEELIEILTDLNPEIDYETCDDLIDGRRIDSISILSLVADIEETFDITIPTVEITPANFNSAKALYAMIERLQDN